jgi:maleate isomerase
MWHSDGIGWRARIGLLTPHNDIVPESEFWAMAPEGVSIHVGRVPFGVSAGTTQVGTDAVRAFAAPPAVDEAAAMLSAAPIHVMVYGFTSSSYILGADADTALKDRLEAHTRGIPVVIPCVAAAACEVSERRRLP